MTNDRRSQSITVSAKTVAEAISEAEQRLGLSRDQIDITVISEGSKGFLGMGGENARILAMPRAILARKTSETSRPSARTQRAQPLPSIVSDADEDPEEFETTGDVPTSAAEPTVPPIAPPIPVVPVVTPLVAQFTVVEAPNQAAPAANSYAAGHVATQDVAEAQEAGEELQGHDEYGNEVQPAATRLDSAQVAQEAVEVVRELLVRLGIDALATVRSTGNPVVIDITGNDLGLLIGRHGDTLGSLQYLVNAIVGKRVHRWCKVVVDVEQYRTRREDTLRALANRQAARVRQSNRELSLDPMPAAERRIIHVTLQNSPFVVTSSVGDEPNRRVVIAPRQSSR